MIMFWQTMWFVSGVLAILTGIGVLSMPWVWVVAPLWVPLALALTANVVLTGIALLMALAGAGGGKR